jgi:hypothetical protein
MPDFSGTTNRKKERAMEMPGLWKAWKAKRGTFISPTGVRSVWLRNDLHTSG